MLQVLTLLMSIKPLQGQQATSTTEEGRVLTLRMAVRLKVRKVLLESYDKWNKSLHVVQGEQPMKPLLEHLIFMHHYAGGLAVTASLVRASFIQTRSLQKEVSAGVGALPTNRSHLVIEVGRIASIARVSTPRAPICWI
jgi:hypothetical protein